LQLLLNERNIDRSEFHRRVKEETGAGPSYSAVWNYVQGTKEPPVEFLLAASRALGVRFEWLVTGRGAPTEAEATHDAEVARQRYAADLLKKYRESHDESVVYDFDLGPEPVASWRRVACWSAHCRDGNMRGECDGEAPHKWRYARRYRAPTARPAGTEPCQGGPPASLGGRSLATSRSSSRSVRIARRVSRAPSSPATPAAITAYS
jgi:transcriptional regulator with XRE-family HTH domain